ncbi:rhodanese-like domain-containing protein [Thalassotalea sp. M1531]|uniref:Rhodanese-like domain-containing protein n=1 Tax=Thalassotalea algicola TaxID=2716224 RepID=A0A7Y0Q501_9GAMM|nr:rhodanese-like domain-containing protein [Thalassotalea algicola]NMP30529.1 rhodanese-like domain-containing protein [Thalassotalea algicola]
MEQLMVFAGNHPLLSTVWVGLVVAILAISIMLKMSPIKQLSPQELTFLVNKESGVIVDIRPEKDFKVSRIIDSVHLPLEKANKNDFSSLEKHKDKPIIVVCAAGLTATKVANQIAKAGFSQVSLLKGGLNAWVGAGLPVTKK